MGSTVERIQQRALALVAEQITPKEFRATVVSMTSMMSDEDTLLLAVILADIPEEV
jgi:hypothetical protein